MADRFPFVQLELAGAVGLGDGRYLAREPAPEHVLVVHTRGAPPSAGRLRRRRPRAAEPGAAPTQLPLTTITVIRSELFDDAESASRWLAALRDDAERLEREVDQALRIANRALHAHRATTLDAYLADLSADQALSVRVGHGLGERLADGRWDEAIELPPSARRRRAEVRRPQERVADVLAGREQVAPCEVLVLRARADLDQGRDREAALQLRAALEALLADVGERGGPRQAEELAGLEERRPPTAEAAAAALRGSLPAAAREKLAETLALCERILKRRRLGYG